MSGPADPKPRFGKFSPAALSRDMYRPCAAHWPDTLLGVYVTRTAQRWL